MGHIKELVLQATDSSLAKPDKDLINQIIDYLLQHPEKHKAATKILMGRFEINDVKVQMFTLYLLDKSMQKLSTPFTSYVGTK